jgi:hypothetical protein
LKFLKEHILFILIFLLCAVLRFIPLFDYQFTYDELAGLDRTQFDSFSDVIEKGVKIDAHPAFVQLLIWYLVKTFGYVTWIIKFPFLVFSLAALIYAYAIGLRNFSKQVGLFASLLFAFSLLFVFYAPIARMYISGIFFSIALLYYFFEIFFLQKNKFSNYFFLGLFALLSALNHHINSLFALTVCLSGLFLLNRQNVKAYLITCALVVLFYLPHLSVTLYQLSVPGIGRENGGWLEAPDFTVIFHFIKTIMGTGKNWLVFVFFMLLCFVLNKKLSFNKKQGFFLFLFIINYLIVYFYSVLKSPVFQYSVMLFSGTAILMFFCSFLDFKNDRVFYTAFLSVFIVLIYTSYFKKDYLHQAVKTVFEYQFEQSAYYKRLFGDKEVYPIFCDADNIMKKIYFNKYQTSFDCKISADSMISNMERTYFDRPGGGKVSSIHLFSEFVSNLKCDYLVLTSSVPLQQAIVTEYFPYLIENTQTQAINFKLYSRKKNDGDKTVDDDKLTHYSTPLNKGNFNYPKANKLVFSKQGIYLKVDSTNEFPFEAKAPLKSVTTKEGEMILAKATLKSKNTNKGPEISISVNDINSNKSYHYTAKSASDFLIRNDSTLIMYSDYFNGTGYRNIRDQAVVGCYFWNVGKENFEITGFELKVIDYWPMKWHFWD